MIRRPNVSTSVENKSGVPNNFFSSFRILPPLYIGFHSSPSYLSSLSSPLSKSSQVNYTQIHSTKTRFSLSIRSVISHQFVFDPSGIVTLSMEAESSTSNQQRKRKRSSSEVPEKSAQSTWRTDKEHHLYSSKLLEALRRVRSGSGSPRTEPPRSRAVREAADRALAISARGRTRWSRAILSSRSIKLKSNRIRVPCPPRPKRTELERIQSADQEKKKSVVLQSKARVLGRLVPGCKKLPFPTLLEEASDYIKALEMQVKAMNALTEILSMIGGGTEGASGLVQDGVASAGAGTSADSMPPPA